ncbi:Uma2 family endonuclease [Leptolyngbya sp. NIES-2104]|uniref:Uma2 family endonuclease n=1 Tax=Leptolyngbya sp. NIES-2104 TaxID=1552121 RepID=UPI0006ECB64F|nr:Uma2 family endonuclease [Leptolyngbya sp. NIES-2104]GAP98367.1 hypothetical protein NIES2104_49220 [Leptolyngbya sp. NIES-2104]
MFQTETKSLTFQQFIEQYGNHDRYELIDGELVDLEPTGLHEQVAAFVSRKLNVAIDQADLPFFILQRCLVRLLGTATAFRPDVDVLDQNALGREPLWRQESIITLGTSIKLAIEVVSQNWENDYARKVEDYAALGIPELWIVDYLGLGGRDYIGYPKQPTLTICELVAEKYQKRLFRGDERLISPTFPSLQLTAQQIFAAGQA